MIGRSLAESAAVAGTMRKVAELELAQSRLLALQADILEQQGDRESVNVTRQARQSKSAAAAWAMASECLREAGKLHRETCRMLTGAEPKPELRVVE